MWVSALEWSSWATGKYLFHHGLLHRLQGNLSSGAWSISPSFFFTDFAVISAISYFFFSLAPLPMLCFCPFLNVFPEVPPSVTDGLSCGCAGAIVEPAGANWKWLCLVWGSPWSPLTEAPGALPPNTLPLTPNIPATS